MTTLEQVIRQHIHLPHYTNAKGWYQVLCKVCNDHGKKGKRAAFLFDNDIVTYNCFNCAHTAIYDPSSNRKMPERMLTVLEAFQIPKEEYDQVLFSALQMQNSNGTVKHTKTQALSNEPKELPLPPYFVQLEDKDDDLHQCAINYLKSERLVDWQSQPFYVGVMIEHPDAKRWFCRVVLPIYKDNKLIFYQGRDLTGMQKRKYLSPNVERENVMYGYDQLFGTASTPLYVVEGWFDAYHLNGVAVLSNKFTDGQILWLKKSPRQKVIIPDQFGNGHILAEKAIELGWSVSTPDIGDCKDVNEAITKYGQLYTLDTIREHTSSGFEALTKLGFYCKEANNDDQRKGQTVHQRTSKKAR